MENVIWDQVSANRRCTVEIRSCIGGRKEQQDRAYVHCEKDEIFAVLCDGMGGTANGEVASDTAITTMRNAYIEYKTNKTDTPSSFLYRALLAADKNVLEKICYKTGGTTMVSVLICDNILFWLSIGDSRLYILRSGEFLQVTRDHNYMLRLNELKRRKKISDSFYRREINRGDALISYIGLGNITLFDLTKTGLELRTEDKLLLATDGLFKIIPLDVTKNIMERKISLSSRADLLMSKIAELCEHKAQDNTTFIIIDVCDGGHYE